MQAGMLSNNSLTHYSLSFYPTMNELVRQALRKENTQKSEQLFEHWSDLFKYFLYWFLDGLIVVFNMLILLLVVCHPALRAKKEYA